MYRFYRTYIALLIPFYLLCLWIKSQGLIVINDHATLKLNLGDLPIEAYFYLMAMLLMCVYLVEFFKNKALKKNG